MRLFWSADAVADRTGILDWYSAENPAVALATDAALSRHAKRLRRFPQLGRPGRVEGTREAPLPRTPFILVYRVADDTMTILRVLHGARQWPSPPPTSTS